MSDLFDTNAPFYCVRYTDPIRKGKIARTQYMSRDAHKACIWSPHWKDAIRFDTREQAFRGIAGRSNSWPYALRRRVEVVLLDPALEEAMLVRSFARAGDDTQICGVQ